MVKTPQGQHTNEIDLVELLLKAVNTFRINFWLIAAFFVVGAGLGVSYFMTAQKQYESKMIISSSILTDSYATVLFDNINGHIGDGEYKLLSGILHLDEDQARQVSRISIQSLKAAGEEKENDRYVITARVYDQVVLPALQQGVLFFLKNNEFVKIRDEQKRVYLEEMISSVNRELGDLQRFKADIQNGKFFGDAKGNVMFDPTSVNTKILDLTEKKLEFENQLAISSSVHLIEGFSVFKHHASPKLLAALASGAFLGLFAVGVLIAFKSIRRMLQIAEKHQKNAA